MSSTSQSASSSNVDASTKTFLVVSMFEGPNSEVNDLVSALRALVQTQGNGHTNNTLANNTAGKRDLTSERDRRNH
ncbi:hypothetical protein NLJ89_g1663 [Agrocybe chaxingu]|uniref:Uncharacterized protein n=1 Tax=Agrocybe chaxingu TaxID=84603 RepID=A0A9W8MZL2_9AGAR|nr:hypothetical protein NLJ89_g1663 [Agrocybe chaxingu]